MILGKYPSFSQAQNPQILNAKLKTLHISAQVLAGAQPPKQAAEGRQEVTPESCRYRLDWGYIGIMENTMEPTTILY